jgi:purine-binding chemotaxis protein CheW
VIAGPGTGDGAVVRHSLTTLLVFELATQRIGIAADAVNEILRAVSVTPLPGSPSVIEGVINLRGTAIPVFGLRARFGFPPSPVSPTDHFVVASTGKRTAAIRADRVIDLITLPIDEIDGIEAITSKQSPIAGVAKLPDGLVLIHDLASFLTAAESEEINRAMEQAAL